MSESPKSSPPAMDAPSTAEHELQDAQAAPSTEAEPLNEQGALQQTALGDADSDDSLSDLDDDNFKDFDESKIGEPFEATASELPSFRRKTAKEPRAKRQKQEKPPPAKRRKGRAEGRRAAAASAGHDGEDDDDDDDDEDQADAGNRRPLDPVAAAKWDLDQAINASIASKKTRRAANDEYDLEQMADEEISKLRNDMRLAALADAEANARREPATNKLQMLPKVEDTLRRSPLYDSILENNLLDSVRMWLEPLPDRSLPALDIQRVLFKALVQLPIQTDHLRESGVGKVVLFYQKSKRSDPTIKRVADRLVGEWSRPIIKRSANFRDRQVAAVDYRPDASSIYRIPSATAEDGKVAARTSIPRANLETYAIAPRANLSAAQAASQKQHDSEQIRKIKARMRAAKADSTRSRRTNMSIEGRGM